MKHKETNQSQIILLSIDGGDTWCGCEVPVYKHYCNKITLLDTDSQQKVLPKTKTVVNHDYPWYYKPSF